MNDRDCTIEKLKQMILEFRDARNWKQFHNPKDVAIALSIEASEILELCRFRTTEEIVSAAEAGDNKEFADEISDVLAYLLVLADGLNIDIASSFERKLKINEEHYPVEKAYGKKLKYTQL